MWARRRSLLFPECIELLEAAAEDGLIGRLAISTDKAPIVEPVAFDYEDRAIVVHPGDGMLADSAPGSLVAFEVDQRRHGDARCVDCAREGARDVAGGG